MTTYIQTFIIILFVDYYLISAPFFFQLLQHKEYFGQYGKVLKVSMSRTASGVIQQFPNNTCSVCVSVYTSYQTISLFIYIYLVSEVV